ncbi:MAG: YqgE/AlgH family protein [Rhodospirillales bacterium]|jgi:putative transcriptional regulator
MSRADGKSGFLVGQLLIAMPQMNDPRFARAVIYVCAHGPEGAMGLVINRVLDSFNFGDLLEQLGIVADPFSSHIRVHFGGPVETGRGFVLHSAEYRHESTLVVDDRIGLTATIDVLKDIVGGQGPKKNILALGYAGWGAGQLEQEISENIWLTAPASEDLLFGDDTNTAWERAMKKIHTHVAPALLAGQAGHA